MVRPKKHIDTNIDLATLSINVTEEKAEHDVIEKFYIKEKGAVLEFINEDGTFSDTPEGRTCVPGHVIECMWFLINIFDDIGDKASVLRCCELIKTHIN